MTQSHWRACCAVFLCSAVCVATLAVPAGERTESKAGEPTHVPREQPAEHLPENLPPEIEALVTESLSDAAYRGETRCLSVFSMRQVDIVTDRYLIFRGHRGNLWLNQLPRRCFGLRPNMRLQSQSGAHLLCHGDRLVAERYDPFANSRANRRLPGPRIDALGDVRCTLGRFEAIDAQQAAALRIHLARASSTDTVRQTVSRSAP